MSLQQTLSIRTASVVLLAMATFTAGCSDDSGTPEEMGSEGSTTASTSSSTSGESAGSSSSGETGSSSGGASSDTGAYVPLDDLCAMSGTPCTDPAEAKCAIVAIDGGGVELGCVAPTGDAGLEEACEYPKESPDVDTCASEMTCLNTGTAEGTACRRICTGEFPCDGGFDCLGFGDSGLGACLPACEPFEDGCGADQQCSVLTDLEGESFGYCEAVGPGALGEDCIYNRDCGDGLLCVAPLAGGVTCEILCRIGVDGDCPEDVLCLPLLDTPGYGFCNPA